MAATGASAASPWRKCRRGAHPPGWRRELEGEREQNIGLHRLHAGCVESIASLRGVFPTISDFLCHPYNDQPIRCADVGKYEFGICQSWRIRSKCPGGKSFQPSSPRSATRLPCQSIPPVPPTLPTVTSPRSERRGHGATYRVSVDADGARRAFFCASHRRWRCPRLFWRRRRCRDRLRLPERTEPAAPWTRLEGTMHPLVARVRSRFTGRQRAQ